MTSLTIRCLWKLDGPLHAGRGLSRVGYADRLIRVDAGGEPFLPGDAVKGALRMSAERLLRWLMRGAEPEKEDRSIPTHPVLRRIFQPADRGVYYRFQPARRRALAPATPFRISATAIDRQSRVALSQTLRTLEVSSRTDLFEVGITGEGGGWSQHGSRDALDGCFLLAAVIGGDSIGAKRGAGYGRIAIEEWSVQGMSKPDLANLATIEVLREHVLAKDGNG